MPARRLRGDVDDPRGGGAVQRRQQFPGEQPRRQVVDGHHLGKAVRGGPRLERVQTGVVDQHVDPLAAGGDFLPDPPDVVEAAQVAEKDPVGTDLPAGLLAALRVTGGDQDAGAAAGEPGGGEAADAAGRAGDDDRGFHAGTLRKVVCRCPLP